MNAKQLSGFMMGVCASAGALASTCTAGYYDPDDGSNCIRAPQGSYVPLAGATAAILAQPGTFVGVTGATAPTPASPGTYVSAAGASNASLTPPGTYIAVSGASAPTPTPVGTYTDRFRQTAPKPAPIGYYVPSTGQTSARAAPIGFYVAATGASAPTPAGPGNYTVAEGATAPIAGGLMASALNLAATGVHELQEAQGDMGNPDRVGFDIRVTSGSTRLQQVGLGSSATQSVRADSLVVQHRAGPSLGDWRLFGGFAGQQLKSITGGTGDGRTWLLGVGRGLGVAPDAPVTFNAYAGQTTSDIVRAVTETSPPEIQKHSGTVRLAGLQVTGGLPVPALSARVLVDGGMRYFRQATITETAADAGATAGLHLTQAKLWTLPAFIGLEHQLPGVRIQWGWRGDLNPRRALTASLASGGSYNFAIPAQGTATSAGTLRLRFNAFELGQGFALDGGLLVEAGPKLHRQQAQLVLSKHL